MAIFHCYVSSPEGKVIVCRINDDLDGFSYVKLTNFHGESIPSIFGGKLRCCIARNSGKPKESAWPWRWRPVLGRCWWCPSQLSGMVISILIGPLSKQSSFWWHILKFSSCFIIFVASNTHTHCWLFCHHFSHMFHMFNHVPHIFRQMLLVNSRLSPSRALRALRALHRTRQALHGVPGPCPPQRNLRPSKRKVRAVSTGGVAPSWLNSHNVDYIYIYVINHIYATY